MSSINVLEQLEEIRYGKRKRVDNSTWDNYENRKAAIEWLVETVRKEGKKWPNTEDVRKYKLGGLLGYYEGSILKALADVYGKENPELIECPWKIKELRVPQGFWTPEKVDKVFDKLLEEKKRVPTATEFQAECKGAASFIFKKRYPGIRNWEEYVKHRGYEPRGRGPRVFNFPEERFLELYSQGLSDEKIAEELGVSPAFVYRKRKEKSLKPNFPPPRRFDKTELDLIRNKILELNEKGYTIPAIAKELRIAKSAVYNIAKKVGIKLEEKITDEQIIETVERYKTLTEAARALGIHPSTLSERASRLGIKSRWEKMLLKTQVVEALREKPLTSSEMKKKIKERQFRPYRLPKNICRIKIPFSNSFLYFLENDEERALSRFREEVGKRFVNTIESLIRCKQLTKKARDIIPFLLTHLYSNDVFTLNGLRTPERELTEQTLRQLSKHRSNTFNYKGFYSFSKDAIEKFKSDFETAEKFYQEEVERPERIVAEDVRTIELAAGEEYDYSTQLENVRISDVKRRETKKLKKPGVVIKRVVRERGPVGITKGLMLRYALLMKTKNVIDAYEKHQRYLTRDELRYVENLGSWAGNYYLLSRLVESEDLNDKVILDLGCGSKSPLLKVIQDKKINCKVIGLDCHKESLEIAKENFPEQEFIRALFPLTSHCFKDGSFDLVFAINSLHYLNKTEKYATFLSLHQLLKKGGKIIVIEDINKSSEYNEIKEIAKNLNYNIQDQKDEKRIDWPPTQKNPKGSVTRHLLFIAKKVEDVDRTQELNKKIGACYLLNAKEYRVKDEEGKRIKDWLTFEACRIARNLGIGVQDLIKEIEKEPKKIRVVTPTPVEIKAIPEDVIENAIKQLALEATVKFCAKAVKKRMLKIAREKYGIRHKYEMRSLPPKVRRQIQLEADLPIEYQTWVYEMFHSKYSEIVKNKGAKKYKT
jgi:SAM-dependent methyltransferase/predicted transcriptional regulator